MSSITTREWFRRMLGVEYEAGEEAPGRVGSLELADFQARAARRGLEMARRFGGVLLADAVGLGKTRVALSIAGALARDARKTGRAPAGVLCVSPARLRPQWRAAARDAGVIDFEVRSHTDLSLKGPGDHRPPVIVVDEAHKFRNPRAKRSQALAELAREAFVVMLSATPICNSMDDLYQLLSVFCAEEDFRGLVGYDLAPAFDAAQRGEFDITELLRYVVIRRVSAPSTSSFGGRPTVELQMLRYEAVEDEAWLWANLEAEIGALELSILRENWPRGLFEEYVLKRWESGARSLAESLERLVEYHRRWLQARACGRTLSRPAFRDLFGDAASLRQEVFPFLFDPSSGDAPADDVGVRRDLRRLEQLHRRAQRLTETGDGRVQAVVELARRLDGKLLAFASYLSSAEELYRALRRGLGPRARLALVTGKQARATGLGRVDPHEILRRFAPMAHGVSNLDDHHQIEVLVATDCLSEGVNLQDCAHIVLADLPYSPLAVEQRVGRLVRPGSVGDTVTVYLPRPRSWSDSLGLRRRLRGKLDAAAQSGAAFAAGSQLLISPPESPADQALDDPLAAMTRQDRLADLLDASHSSPPPRGAFVAAARHEEALWVRYATRADDEVRYGWLRATRADGVVARLGEHVPWLIAASETDEDAEEGEPAGGLNDACERFLRRRERRLRAARAAPRQIGLGSPQRLLWQLLRAGADEGEISVSRDEMGALREALLRSHTRGRLRHIERAVAAGLDARRALGLARRLAKNVESRSDDIDIEVIGRLYMCDRRA